MRAEASNDFFYTGWLDQNDQARIMWSQGYFLEAETFKLENWQIRSNAKVVVLKDENQQTIFDHIILRQITGVPFFLQAGLGGSTQSFARQVPGYWNPSGFEVYGLRFVASKDLFKYWNAEVRLHLGQHREKVRRWEPESATEFHIRYTRKPGWHVHLSGNFLNSNKGAWWKQDLGLRLEVPL